MRNSDGAARGRVQALRQISLSGFGLTAPASPKLELAPMTCFVCDAGARAAALCPSGENGRRLLEQGRVHDPRPRGAGLRRESVSWIAPAPDVVGGQPGLPPTATAVMTRVDVRRLFQAAWAKPGHKNTLWRDMAYSKKLLIYSDKN